MKIYLVGSLKDDNVRNIAEKLREAGHEVFDDWHACGPEADMHWQRYEEERGRNYGEALQSHFRMNAFHFDLSHLNECDIAIAACKPNSLPGIASVSELSYVKWVHGHPTYILLNGEPSKWDMMLPLAGTIRYSLDEILEELNEFA